MKLKLWFVGLLVVVSIAMMSLQFKADLDAPSIIWALTPMYAAGLMFGARMNCLMACALLIGIQLTGASLIGWMTGHWDWAFYGWGQVVNILALLSTTLFGRFMLHDDAPAMSQRIAAGIGAAVTFFLLSNLGTWAFPPTEPALYPKTLAGLGECYVMGLPHFRMTIVASAAYAVVLFSEVVLSLVSASETAEQPVSQPVAS